MKMCTVNNTLIPKSDQHLISPFNITPELHIKVMRIEGRETPATFLQNRIQQETGLK